MAEIPLPPGCRKVNGQVVCDESVGDTSNLSPEEQAYVAAQQQQREQEQYSNERTQEGILTQEEVDQARQEGRLQETLCAAAEKAKQDYDNVMRQYRAHGNGAALNVEGHADRYRQLKYECENPDEAAARYQNGQGYASNGLGPLPAVSSPESLEYRLRNENIPGGLMYDPFARENVYADPEMIAMQQRALAGLEEQSKGELTQVDRENMAMMQDMSAQRERSQREAAMQQAAMRGASGSGAEMAAILGAQQAGAGRAYQDATQMKIAARQQALAAMEALRAGASQAREQGFGEAWDRATASDQRAMGNTDYARQVADTAARRRAEIPEIRFDQQYRNATAGGGGGGGEEQQQGGGQPSVWSTILNQGVNALGSWAQYEALKSMEDSEREKNQGPQWQQPAPETQQQASSAPRAQPYQPYTYDLQNSSNQNEEEDKWWET